MKKIIILLFLSIISINAFSSEDIYDDTKIYLMTIGPGDDIYLRWGHFALLVDYPDGNGKKDIIYDYGNFDPRKEKFYAEFINGVMDYYKASKRASVFINYNIYTNRSILLQELNFSPKQKREYIDKLQWDMRPENRVYKYDQFKNNCVTEVIKDLEKITDGDFLKGSSRKIGRSYRELARDYVHSNIGFNFLISLVLGSKVEYDITVEESLFLPDYTSNWADQVYLEDESGKRPLIKEKIVLNESVDRDPVVKNSKPRVVLYLIIGIVIGIITLLISRFYRIKSVIYILAGLCLFFAGSVLFFMGFFTGHYYIHNNWNLVLMNPLSIIITISSIMKLGKKHRVSGERLFALFTDSTLLLSIAVLVLKFIGLINQENGEIMAFFLPVIILNSSFIKIIPFLNRKGN